MIGTVDIKEFIIVACGTLDRNELSEKGAAGTVTRVQPVCNVFDTFVILY